MALTNIEHPSSVTLDVEIRIAVENNMGEPVPDAGIHIVALLDEFQKSDPIYGTTNEEGIAEGTHKGFPLAGNLPLEITIVTPQYEEMHEAMITRDGLDITLTLGAGNEATESKRVHRKKAYYSNLNTEADNLTRSTQ